MALVPLEGEAKAADISVLELTDRQVQQAGVRSTRIGRRDLAREIDAFGEVDYDERRVSHITSWIGGRIERLHVNFPGQRVKEGQTLVELYSPSLLVAVGDFQEAKKALRGLREEVALRQAREIVKSSRLILYRRGLEVDQVKEIEARIDRGLDPFGDEAIPTVKIRAKSSGVVVEKRVEKGNYVKEGTELLRIADLSVVWVYADVYEYELPYVDQAARVSVATRSHPGKAFPGTIGFVDPFLNRKTRTVRIRIDLKNDRGELKPGMFARVRMRKTLPGLLSIPESAVLHTGRRKLVFIREGKGRFRPKMVRLGRMWLYPAGISSRRLEGHERYHEVLEGVNEGDEVVIAGNFLLSAEAQFQGALRKMMEPAVETGGVSECAWDGRRKATSEMRRIDAGGERLFFCTVEEESQFHRAPEESWSRYLRKFRSGMNAVLPLYYSVGDALAADRPDAKGFAKIRDAARLPEPAPRFSKKSVGRLRERVESIRRAAQRGAGTEVLVEARRAYGALSNELVAYVKEHARERIANRDLLGYRCGMAGRRYGIPSEDWIQPKKGPRNPYMGRAPYMGRDMLG